MDLLNLTKIYLQHNKTHNGTKNYTNKSSNIDELNIFLLIFCPFFFICFFCWSCWCFNKKHEISTHVFSKSSLKQKTNIYPHDNLPPIIDQINETDTRQSEMTVKYNRIRTESN